MNLYNLDDPKLQFGTDFHVDNKFGLMHYGPFDLNEDRRPEKIVLGVIGSPESISGVVRWLKGIEQGVSAKASSKPNLFPRYPGIQEGSPFRTRLVFEKALQDSILPREYVSLSVKPEGEERFLALAAAFVARAKNLKDKGADLVVIALPVEVFPLLGAPAYEGEEDESDIDPDSAVVEAANPNGANAAIDDENKPARQPHFHDVLKSVAMQAEVPIQIVRPSTYDEKLKRKETDRYGKTRRLQDPATRAWKHHGSYLLQSWWHSLENPAPGW